MRPNTSIMPMICIIYMNLSSGFLPVIISYIVKTICPPSKAGIGSRFITPNIMDRSAMILRKLNQSHEAGKTCPMAMKLPTDFYASVLGVNTNFRSLRYPPMVWSAFTNPPGIASVRLYSFVVISGVLR